MTCFGGGREYNETMEDCVKRECKEEFGMVPNFNTDKNNFIDLYVENYFIARFFIGNGPTKDEESNL